MSSPSRWRGVSGDRPKRPSATVLPPLPLPGWLVSRCICHLPQLWRLTWRVSLLVLGIGFAEIHFIADYVYTRGANQLTLSDLQWAARLFPYDHYYRLAPAQLVIRDNVWYTPAQALAILHEARAKDPYSRYLLALEGVFLERGGKRYEPELGLQGRTTVKPPWEEY